MSGMQLLELNQKFLSNPAFGGPVMSGAFFARTSILQGLQHTRNLLVKHGLLSAANYFEKLFDQS